MGFIYDDYSGEEGILRFAEIAGDFDFGPHLPRAAFPRDFVEAYVTQFDGASDDDEYFLARFDNGVQVMMLESIEDPAHIHSQNAILAESVYAEAGAVILPPGYVTFGTALEDARWQLMVCVDQGSSDYGRITVWKRAHDALGEGDNTQAMGFVAPNLRSFLDQLGPRSAF